MKYPVSSDMVVAVLRSGLQTLAELRDELALVVATLACLRPVEGAALQVCDVRFDHDARAGEVYSCGTAALNVLRRKNDQMRKGHHPRLGRAEDPGLDPVHQLKVYMLAGGLEVSEHCKMRNPHARCRGGCPPLFPRAVREAGGHPGGVLGDDPVGAGAGGGEAGRVQWRLRPPRGHHHGHRGGGAGARAVDAVGPRAGQGGAAVRGAERHEPGLAVPDVSCCCGSDL